MRYPVIFGVTSAVVLFGGVYWSMAAWWGFGNRPAEHRAESAYLTTITTGDSSRGVSEGESLSPPWTPPQAKNPTPIEPLRVTTQRVVNQTTDTPVTMGTTRAEAETMQAPAPAPQPKPEVLIRKNAHNVCEATGGYKKNFYYKGVLHWRCVY